MVAWFFRALLATGVAAACCATPACSSGSYTCSGEGRAQAVHLMSDLEGLTSVLSPAVMDDCDSGGGVFISFNVTDFDSAVAELEANDACHDGSLPEGESAQDARAPWCSFSRSVAELVVTRDLLRGEATPVTASN